MVEIFPGENTAAAFQSVAVYGPALDRIVLDNTVGPLAELDRPVIVDFEAYRDDGLQIVVVCVVLLSV